jgi:excisionase family DNA binding protein
MRALDHQPFTDDEQLVLEKLEQLLANATSVKLLSESEEETIELSGTLFQLLQQIVHSMGEGKMFFVQEEEEILTTQEAADILHVSRPYLIKLLEEGEMPFTKVGLHRRIRFKDLRDYQKRRKEERRAALREMARISQELGLYDKTDNPLINRE